MMRIVPTLSWRLDDGSTAPLDDRLLRLLEAVAASASLTTAVADCGIPYRTAWGLLRDSQLQLGVALVRLERGRGASLTPAGERLLRAQRDAALRLARTLPGLAVELGPGTGHETADSVLRLRVAASHDLALASLAESLPVSSGLALDLSFMGSLHALEAYAEDRADVAGFHVPVAGCPGLDRRPYLQRLRRSRDRLIRFVDREQGLILPRGNPARLKHFRDIALAHQRFVNRQTGSGTRLLIDQLIAEGGLEPADIAGYRREEFTHGAVAATVASGGADVGFGLRAAAAEYHLAFIPLVRERYFFAVRASDLRTAPIARLIATLRGRAFTRLARRAAGYRTAAAGSVVGLDGLRRAARGQDRQLSPGKDPS